MSVRALFKSRMEAGGEEAAACIVETFLLSEAGKAVFAEFGWPDITHWEREFPLPRGRADFAVFHVDGSVTVIEVKRGDRPILEILSGIGQVTMYAVQVGYSKASKGVRRMLAVTAPREKLDEVLIWDACEAAGVQYCGLGSLEKHQAIWAAAKVEVDGQA